MVSSLALLYWTDHVMLTLPTAELKARRNSLTSGKALPALGERIKLGGESEWISISFWAYWRGLTAYSKHRANLLEETTPVSPAMTFQCNNTVAVGKTAVSVLTTLGDLLRWHFQHAKLRGRGQKATSRNRKLLWLPVMVFTERENLHGDLVIQVDIYLRFKWPLFQIMEWKSTGLMIHIMNKF